jgi:hypothetical protein
MNEAPLERLTQSKNRGMHYYMRLMGIVVTGPAVFSAYVFAAWDLTANLGLTSFFPWSAGPLSNWMSWLFIAFPLHVVASNFYSAKTDSVIRTRER